MLRRFLYLDEDQLGQYISQVEDGLREKQVRSSGSESHGRGGVKVGPVSGDHSRERSSSETADYVDSPQARFNRLIELVAGNEEDFEWIDVNQDADLESATVGTLVNLEADLYESDLTKLTGPNGALSILPAILSMQSLFSDKNKAIEGLPPREQIDAMGAFAASMPDQIIHGDIADTEWTICGMLPAIEGIEGYARIVGKVGRIIGKDKQELLPGIPLVEQLPRKQRREMQAKGPQPGQEIMWIEGPALILDILAVYR